MHKPFHHFFFIVLLTLTSFLTALEIQFIGLLSFIEVWICPSNLSKSLENPCITQLVQYIETNLHSSLKLEERACNSPTFGCSPTGHESIIVKCKLKGLKRNP